MRAWFMFLCPLEFPGRPWQIYEVTAGSILPPPSVTIDSLTLRNPLDWSSNG
jgi:hypothetical protein